MTSPRDESERERKLDWEENRPSQKKWPCIDADALGVRTEQNYYSNLFGREGEKFVDRRKFRLTQGREWLEISSNGILGKGQEKWSLWEKNWPACK